MYFNGVLEIDPSQITVFKKVKPSKLFAKLKDVLSFGALSDKQEHETFTAVSILQQMNMGLRSITVKNVIRLAVDDYDFYLDEKGVDDDLEQAMFEFKAKVDPLESELFDAIYLVLEHIDDHLKYLIEISITRKHIIGEYPIKINVNAVLKDLKYLDEDSSKDRLKAKIEEIFNDQDKYNTFVNEKKKIFNNFLDELVQAIKKFIRIDDITVQSNTQIIRLKESIKSPIQIRHGRYSEPVHYGYYGIDNFFFYTVMWSSLMYHNNIYCSNCMIVDSLGNPIMNVGETGFNAGESNTLNDEAQFEPPADGDIEYFGGNEFDTELNASNLISSSDDTEGADSDTEDSSWLDTAAEGESGACSSCSSCSSCGGCT
ncbi:hypothetical protein ACFLSQ_01175 [Bacteroidota bacterium]